MRVNLFINEKNIQLKRQLVDLSKHENLKPKYLKLNPWGTIPFLIIKKDCIAESMAICKFLDKKYPTPYLFGRTAMEQAKIEMIRRKIEYDGINAVGEAFRNASKAFKNRALAGPVSIDQIPQLIKRGKKRTEIFFDFLNNILKKSKFVSGNSFSVADIDAYVTLSFAKWIKIDGNYNRKYVSAWSKKLEKRKAFKNYFNLIK